MSAAIKLTDNSLDLDEWSRLLEDWAETRSELYYQPEFRRSADDEAIAHVLAEGSTRGVVIYHRDGEVELWLGALASRKDWAVGFELLRRAVEDGGGAVEAENGDRYALDDLTPDKAALEALRDFVPSCATIREKLGAREAETRHLPMGFFSMPITVDDVPECTPENAIAVEERLAERLDKYADANFGQLLQLEDGSTVSTWDLTRTLIHACDTIAIHSGKGARAPILLPFEKVREVLGDRVEDLLEGVWFLPEIDPATDDQVIDTFARIAVDSGGDGGFILAGGDEEISPGDPANGGGQPTAEHDIDYERVKEDINFLLEKMQSGANPESAVDALVARGVDRGSAEGLFTITSHGLHALISDRSSPQDAIMELSEKGLPLPMAVAVIKAILAGLGE